MISTSNIITDLNQVPSVWPFEYYLNLNEKLVGQDIKILSVFNKSDKVPSMCLYTSLTNNEYRFKDFSSGYVGDRIDLVRYLFSLPSRGSASFKIMADYQDFIKNNTYHEAKFEFHDKFKVVDYEIRHWNSLDEKYWTSFKLNSKMLKKYNIQPLEYFTMEKTELDDSVKSYKFIKNFLYGYFREDGSLYKIYMPKNLDKKFIKVENYIQGIDQLTYSTKYLIITSSLKDLTCFNMLGIGNIESIAPDSENSMIGETVMNKLILQYNKIIVLFDNDGPGKKAAERYKDKYGFNFIILDMSKDLSDSVKDHGIEAVRNKLFPLLKQIL